MSLYIRQYLNLLLFLIGCVIVVIFSLSIFSTSFSPTDFCQDYRSAQLILAGKQIYQQLNCWVSSYPAPYQFDPHPPFSLFLYIPFSFFPIPLASFLWDLIEICCFIVAIALLLLIKNIFSWKKLGIFLIIVSLWPPFLESLLVHNVMSLLLLLFVLDWYFEEKGKDTSAGIVLGLAFLLRLWPGVLLLWALVRGKFTIFWVGVIEAIVGLLISYFLIGQKAYMDYFTYVQTNEDYWILHKQNISLPGFLLRIFSSVHLPWKTSVLLAESAGILFLLACFGYLWWIYTKSGKKQIVNVTGYSFLLSITLFSVPLVWSWELVLLIVPIFVFFVANKKGIQKLSHWQILLLYICGLLLFNPDGFVTSFTNTIASTWIQIALTGLACCGVLLFVLYQGQILWHLRYSSKDNKA